MRKMTKTAAVVAAMSALTVASASVAFAAVDQRTNLSSLGKEAAADAAAVGEWDETDDGWTFTVDGDELAGTWAEIDGAWYYFHKDGIMAEDELVYLEGETYYFHPDGRMQADGWISLNGDGDEIYEYGLDIEEYDKDIRNAVDGASYDKVWMLFNADGTAYDDEWATIVDETTGGKLHYYFDDIIMVCGDYDHDVNGTIYGFGADGHMFVGWEQNYDDQMKSAPNKDADVWYYYATNGKKFVAENKYAEKDDDVEEGFAWKEIDDNWYCFMNEEIVTGGDSCGTLICDVYFCNNELGSGNDKYYYVDKKGVMQTGVKSLAKDTKYVTGDWASSTKTKAATEILLKSSGEANPNAWSGDSFYAKSIPSNVWTFESNTEGVKDKEDAKYADIVAHLVKSAFVYKNDMYLIDKYGDKVENSAIQVGMITIDGEGKISFDQGADDKSQKYTYKAYVLANSKGVIYESDDVEVEDGRTVKVGAKKYTPVDFTVDLTDKKANDGAGETYKLQVFYYANEN